MKNISFSFVPLLLAVPLFLRAQSNPNFNVNLRIDYSSADETIDLCEGRLFNVNSVADLRGTQLAATTSILLARKQYTPDVFRRELELLRDNSRSPDDIFGLAPVRAHLSEIKALLLEAKKNQLDRRVVATIAQFFPGDCSISADLPVYIVAFGNENAAAFVRRVVWNGNTPVFVGENEGEPVIVVNLERFVDGTTSTETQFIQTLSTLAHETFHAVFAVYQSSSPVWRDINSRRSPFWSLAELVQNEGIAYRISFQEQTGGTLPPYIFASAKNAIAVLSHAMSEMSSPSISEPRARELLMDANLSGSFEKNYGAAAGLLMAFAIDSKMGRTALTETIAKGVGDFFQKYDELTKQYDELPKLSDEVMKEVVK
ncbi:MAG TPA: DUF5700 domain-containing putative Zn-dependent protease [Bacteroidota bacterium]|nr:DUF5700 domain-containing putative Zn-dependent protease [Bacteroidota bacterium]